MSANTEAKPAAMTGSSPSSSAAAPSPLAHFRPHQHHAPMTPPSAPAPPSPASGPRDYRKGNWTLQETLVLITAKRLDDDRRAGGAAAGSPTTTPRSAEQRWKWVENHCWEHGCLRSQNQCNDKWDNLLRDYKKVRDYEARAAAAHHHRPYWSMERHERKDNGLPTNLAPDVYTALSDVLARRAARRGGAAILGNPPPPPLALPPPKPLHAQPRPPPPPLLPMPAGMAPPPATTSVSGEEVSGSSESGDDDEEEASDEEEGGEEPDPKRRRLNRLGSSVERGATVLARTLTACEEKRERRHRELMGLEERRLRLEEERTEARRQGFAGVISAVNGLSAAIHALVTADSSRARRPSS